MKKPSFMKDIPESGVILYHDADGKSDIRLYSRDGKVWLSQKQMAELFATSTANISIHISKILKEKELHRNSVVKHYLTTGPDGKDYNVEWGLRQLRNDIRTESRERSQGVFGL